MKSYFILLLINFSVFLGNAQILDNTQGQTFGEVPFFNEDFIKRNKIKAIKGYYATKASLDYIKKSEDIYYYEFNEKGQLKKDYRTQYGDTLIALYEYDSIGRLSILRKSDNGGFHSYHFMYDQKNRIVSKEYRRDINKTGNKDHFELDKSFIVSIEKFKYVALDGLNYKKIYLNNAGIPYKDEFFYFDENKLLVKQEGRFKIGSGLSYTAFIYDEKGRVQEKLIEKKGIGNSKLRWKYEYDLHENVLAEHYYKNDNYITEKQIVYYEDSFLLKAIVSKVVETEFVTILQFSEYTYFN